MLPVIARMVSAPAAIRASTSPAVFVSK